MSVASSCTLLPRFFHNHFTIPPISTPSSPSTAVGYQNVSANTETKLLTTTFVKVDGTAKKLGDYIPQSSAAAKNWKSSNFYINFYNSKGAQRRVVEDTEIARIWPAAILDPAVSNGAVQVYYEKRDGKTEGWYLAADTAQSYPMADYQIQNGDGFLMKVAKAMSPLALTYAGAVDEEDTPLSVNTETILTGNVASKAIKLGDIILTSSAAAKNWKSSNFYLNFYDSKGAQRRVVDDSEIARLYPAAIIDPAVSNGAVQVYYEKRDGKTEGWYLAADTAQSYPMAEYQINPGDGFLLKAAKAMSPITVTLPGTELK